MKLISFVFIVSFLCIACYAQRTALPAEAPAGLSISYRQGGGMSRSYRTFVIEDGVLSYEELKGHGRPKVTWTATVFRSEMLELYRIIRANGFDLIENDKRDAIVYDAGSESIGVSLGAGKVYRITYGHNSPLSGRSLERYREVKKALDALLERHRPSPGSGDADGRLYGTWRVSGESGRHAWFLQWKFADGAFEQRGYPPLFQKGRYRIANVEGDRFTVELYDQKGNFGAANRTIRVEFDGETVTIAGRGGYKRIGY